MLVFSLVHFHCIFGCKRMKFATSSLGISLCLLSVENYAIEVGAHLSATVSVSQHVGTA